MTTDGTFSSSPALSHANRPMPPDCSPTWLTHPVMTSSTVAESMPLRSTSARKTWPRSSTGWIDDNAPPGRPSLAALPFAIGDRIASTITAVLMCSHRFRGSSSEVDASEGLAQFRPDVLFAAVDCGLSQEVRPHAFAGHCVLPRPQSSCQTVQAILVRHAHCAVQLM